MASAGNAEDVKVLGFWGSPYTLRVKWALKLKGVSFEYVEEDVQYNKSPLLLQYNPVHKKVPVLVHNGKPVPESLLILEYIDETWRQSPSLLPQDTYERSRARFWAKFADEKCVPAVMGVFSKKGEDQEKAVEEAREHLKTLESGLDGKRFFGGKTINYTDIAVGWIGLWVSLVEEITGTALLEPSMDAWFTEFLELPLIKEFVPPWEKLLELNTGFHEMLTSST